VLVRRPAPPGIRPFLENKSQVSYIRIVSPFEHQTLLMAVLLKLTELSSPKFLIDTSNQSQILLAHLSPTTWACAFDNDSPAISNLRLCWWIREHRRARRTAAYFL